MKLRLGSEGLGRGHRGAKSIVRPLSLPPSLAPALCPSHVGDAAPTLNLVYTGDSLALLSL